jgi:hypothetical protein
MRTCSLSALAVLGCAVSLVASGCLTAAPPENEVTWAVKAAAGHLTEATVTEWQAVAEVIDEVIPGVDVTLTEAQAEAIVEFVQANEINDLGDVEEMVDQAQTDPESIEVPDAFMELFGGFSDEDFDSFPARLME